MSGFPRLEDERLLTGRGRFIADRAVPGMLHAAMLRSPHARARITAIRCERARAYPGVRAILTASEAKAEGLGGIPWEVRPPDVDDAIPIGDPAIAMPQPVLAAGEVRYVGEIVAVVVAETDTQARDAAEAVEVDYAPLTPAVGAEEAADSNAPQLWPQSPGNVCFALSHGDRARAEGALAGAAHVFRLRFENPRMVANPIETRGYIGAFDSETGRYTLDAAAGKPHPVRDTLAAHVLRIPAERLRIRVGDIGGGFGAKNTAYPEQALVLWAARRTGRPVRWIADRGESFLSDVHGRDQVTNAAIGLDGEGRIVSVTADTLADLGAYLAPRGVNPPKHALRLIPSVYHVPCVWLRARAVFTNTVPTCPVRGAGQPEGNYVIERLIDAAARGMGLSSEAIMRRNLIPKAAMPYRTETGLAYDSGNFAANLDGAIALSDASAFEERRAASEAMGKLRGLGIANCLGADGFGLDEHATLALEQDGALSLRIGTMSSGQSHETSYAMLAAEPLGIAPERVRVVQGDTDDIETGSGTGACRSLTVGGTAVRRAAEALIEAGKPLAADVLEAAVEDIAYGEGRWRVAGTDRAVDLAGLAPVSVREGFDPPDFTFPNGCYVAEVEIDPDTGTVSIEDFAIAHDVGIPIHRGVVEGQITGGAAMGIGQALGERVIFDAVDGQLSSGSLLDYSMPRADTIPNFRFALNEDEPCRNNPLGAKSCGEAGPSGAPPAVIAAILDALAPLGVRDIDMPATPERVWRAIQDARRTGDG